MDGANSRLERERSLVWWAGMLQRAEKYPAFDEFVKNEKARPDYAKCVSAWDKIDRALMANRSN